MFREMRRKRQALSSQEIDAVLHGASSGVLALHGDHDYPYAVPISYVYDGENLYFHCAKSGHKWDAIQRNAKASFCVIDQDHIVPQELTTYFRSVIVFGRIRVIEDEERKIEAITKLVRKYAPLCQEHEREKAVFAELGSLGMLEMQIDRMSGKEAIELVKQKEIR